MEIPRSNIDWHFEVLPLGAKRALIFLSTQDWLKNSKWYLAGGTALALQIGHRQSMDLDFFLPQAKFYGDVLIGHLEKEKWHTDVFREGTIYGRLYGAKISFIAYPFFHPGEFNHYGSIKVLSCADIAVMKIIAISQRGLKRDFIDLYWYAQNRESILEVVRRLPNQYPSIAYDYHHILKSLMYFEV